jgi:hypothetical protein
VPTGEPDQYFYTPQDVAGQDESSESTDKTVSNLGQEYPILDDAIPAETQGNDLLHKGVINVFVTDFIVEVGGGVEEVAAEIEATQAAEQLDTQEQSSPTSAPDGSSDTTASSDSANTADEDQAYSNITSPVGDSSVTNQDALNEFVTELIVEVGGIVEELAAEIEAVQLEASQGNASQAEAEQEENNTDTSVSSTEAPADTTPYPDETGMTETVSPSVDTTTILTTDSPGTSGLSSEADADNTTAAPEVSTGDSSISTAAPVQA